MTVTKPYTFTGGTPIDSSEVNADFDELYDALNNDYIDKAATLPFENIPTGPAEDPTTANQLTRKAYVDAGDQDRLKAGAGTMVPMSGVATDFSNQQLLVQGGMIEVLTDGNGFYRIVFPSAFPNGVLTCSVLSGDYTDGLSVFSLGGVTNTYMDVLTRDETGGPRNTETIKFVWMAVGW